MMKTFHNYSIAFGIILLSFLIWKIGPAELLNEFTAMSWGIVILILLEGLGHLFHAVGWKYCMSGSSRSLSILHLFRVHMAGHSISYLTPTAGLGGEVTKGTLLSRNNHGHEAASGVIIGKVAFALAHLLYVVVGSALVFSKVDLGGGLFMAMLLGILLVGGGIVAFLIIQKHGKLGAVIRWMGRHHLGGKRMEEISEQVSRVDGSMQLFYREQRWDLPLAVAWNIVGLACGIGQSWVFLYMLTGGSSLVIAAAISFIGNWMDLVGFAIPSDIGILEGTRVLVFSILGFSSTMGLTYGVTLRFLQVFWAVAGLLIYATFLMERKGKWFVRRS